MPGLISGVPNARRSQKALLLAKAQTAFGVAAPLSLSSDALLAGNIDVKINGMKLTRNIMRPSLSPTGEQLVRKIVQLDFEVEIKGSGSTTRQSSLGRLLSMCSMAEVYTAAGASSQVGPLTPNGLIVGSKPTLSPTVAPTQYFGRYIATVVTSGPAATAAIRWSQVAGVAVDPTVFYSESYSYTLDSNSALSVAVDTSNLTAPEFTISGNPTVGEIVTLWVGGVPFNYAVQSSDTTASALATSLAAALAADSRLSTTAAASGIITLGFSSGAAAEVITSDSTALPIGGSGASADFVLAGGSLVAGDQFKVTLLPVGYSYQPTSTNNPSYGSFRVWFDGQAHDVYNCLGTVALDASAGAYGKATFSFQGQYLTPGPAELPNPSAVSYESSIPEQVQNANLTVGGITTVVNQSFKLDLANKIDIRDDMNRPDGYNGVLLSSRAPVGSINPEAQNAHWYRFWDHLEKGDYTAMSAQVGHGPGLGVVMIAPSAQVTGIGYGNRNNNRIYDISTTLSSPATSSGDDEMLVIFL